MAITAWAPSGFMGGVLRLAAGRHGSAQPRVRPERWGRFETAFLHFSGFDDFEMLEATLQMQFEGDDEMWELFASPPGPLAGAVRTAGDADALREEFVRLAAASRSETTPGVALDVEYAVVLGRRQGLGACFPVGATLIRPLP